MVLATHKQVHSSIFDHCSGCRYCCSEEVVQLPGVLVEAVLTAVAEEGSRPAVAVKGASPVELAEQADGGVLYWGFATVNE